MSAPRKLELRDAATAATLGVGYLVWLLRTVKDLGYARDEGFYFQAAGSYGRWFELLVADPKAALARRVVDAAWSTNHEHPALIKSLFALSSTFLQKKWHLFAMEGTSYRFPAMALAGLAVALVYLWGTEARGRLAGLSAALMLAFMPRIFFQAHLACFDVPIVAVWTLGAYAWWRALREGRLRDYALAGVAFGLALDTKHNSWFLPIACAGHLVGLWAWALLLRTRVGGYLPIPSAGRALQWSPEEAARVRARALVALAAMALVGPVVLYALWPWIWHDTLPRLRDYALFHLNHEYYNMEFLGKNYWAAPMPRGYAWLMTLGTVPGVTLVLFAVGISARGRVWLGGLVDRGRTGHLLRHVDAAGSDLFWLVGLLVNYVAWLSPRTPIFGGTKHWMTAYPFLALFAGVGFDVVVRAARVELSRLRRRAPALRVLAARAWAVPALVGVSVLAAPLTETVRSHPWGLSAYTPLVGGAAGAATLGLNRTFWGYAVGAEAEWLDRNAPQGATVYIHDTAWPSWEMLGRDGRLRRDIRGVGSIAGASYGLYFHEKHMLGQEYQNWVAFGTVRPAVVAGLDGVPVLMIYEDPRLGGRPRK